MRSGISRRTFFTLAVGGVMLGCRGRARAGERKAVESSSIASVGYDVAARTMEVEFRNGRIYRYRDVPREIFDGLMKSVSKGRYFIERIRGKFDYERAPR